MWPAVQPRIVLNRAYVRDLLLRSAPAVTLYHHLHISRFAQHGVFHRIAAVAVVIIAMLTIAIQPSEASPSSVAAYSKEPSTRVTMQIAIGPTQGPSHCVQKANNPHLSKHMGWMSAEVTASCRAKVNHMYHTAQLWENRWWGGEQIGVPDKFDGTNVGYGAANAHADCVTDDPIWVTGEGYVVDTDGQTYQAATESNHVTNPCQQA